MSIECEISRDFKGIWIPKQIWTDKRLSYFEKCLLSEIHSLDGENGCFASNQYFCKFFDERERKIQQGISKLKELGYVYLHNFDGRTRVLKTCLENNDKSKFSTPEVSNSAPLGCRIPHPYSIEYSKDNIATNTHPNPPSGNVCDSVDIKQTPREKGTNPRAMGTNPRAQESQKESFGEYGNCKLTSQEHEKLKEKLGQTELDYWIETIDLEVEKQGAARFNKKYKNHSATILSWKRMRGEKVNEKKFHSTKNPKAAHREPDQWEPTFLNKKGRP